MDGFRVAARAVVGEIGSALEAVREDEVEGLVDDLLAARVVALCGIGRVGVVAQALSRRWWHLGLECHGVDAPALPPVGESDLLVAVSGSGESVVPLALARRAGELGTRVVHIGASPTSSLARLADRVVTIPAPHRLSTPGSGASVQPMTTLFEQAVLLLGDVVALLLQQRLGGGDAAMYGRHTTLE